MKYEIEGAPDYALLQILIPRGETLKVEASSMASMDANLLMKTKTKGGLSRILNSESMFINEFTAQGKDGEITIAAGPSGDIGHHEIKRGEDFYLSSSSFMASTTGVKQETKWEGFKKGFFSGAGFFLLKNSGVGHVWFNCYGAIFEIDVAGEYTVDTSHIVAFTQGLTYKVRKLDNWKTFLFSGEGLVAKFQGQGKIWIQTKSPQGLVGWAHGFRRQRPRSQR